MKNSVNSEQENKTNHLKELYGKFNANEISDEISNLLKTDNIVTDFEIIFQTVENLHQAIPNHRGDWYFTGNYPTSGGNLVANKSFVYYIEGNDERAY